MSDGSLTAVNPLSRLLVPDSAHGLLDPGPASGVVAGVRLAASPVDAIPTELLRSTDPAWDERLVDIRHDVYHTAAYHRYAEGCGEGEAWLAVAGDEHRTLVWPYLLRPLPDSLGSGWAGRSDVTSVYGYPGPLARGCQPGDPFLECAFAAIAGAWRGQGAVSAFTRFHPVLGNAELMTGPAGRGLIRLPGDPVQCEGPTVSIDCDDSDEVATSLYPRQLRQALARGRRAGMVTVHDRSWTYLEDFSAAYRETMIRNRASADYFFDCTDFRRLRDLLGEQVHLLETRIGDVVIAGGLFFEVDGMVQAHLVGVKSRYLALSPFKVMLDDARRWARARGNHVLHLGGGRGGACDELLRFKGLFSPRRHEYYTGRWMLDPVAYRELVAARRSAAPDAEIDGCFFPSYRTPTMAFGEADPVVETVAVR